MSNYLGNLVNRIQGAAPVVYPRLGSRFESPSQRRNGPSSGFLAIADETLSPAAPPRVLSGESGPAHPRQPSTPAPPVAAAPPEQTVQRTDQLPVAHPHHPSPAVEWTPTTRASERPEDTTPERSTIDFQRIRRTVTAQMRTGSPPLVDLQAEQAVQAVQHPAPVEGQSGAGARSTAVPAQGKQERSTPRLAPQQPVMQEQPGRQLSSGSPERSAPQTPSARSAPSHIAPTPPVEPTVQSPPQLAPRPLPPQPPQATAKEVQRQGRPSSSHEQGEGQPRLQPRGAIMPHASALPGSLPASQQPSPPAPTIRVTIGRVEVRATPPPSSPANVQRAAPQPSLSLDAYLKRRGGGN
jgi:hypothetical protein